MDPLTHGSTFVPVILGSDKTVVSVATGHTEYWPLYLSIGNVHNHLHQAHKGAVAVISFLSIPKSMSTIIKPILSALSPYLSEKEACWVSQILPVQTQVVPHIHCQNITTTPCSNDGTRTCLVWWRSLSTCCVWSGTIYRRLQGTNIVSMYCTRLVWKVSNLRLLLCEAIEHSVCRCIVTS